MALVLSWAAIIAYLWLRFGSASWGLAAVICLVHDSIIVTGCVAISAWLSTTSIGQALLISPFKIDLALIAAILTIIGYSVNDTIVIFDRIRENRGKLKTVSPQVINASINQTLSRTVLTGSSVLLTVLIMYIWAGESIRGFNYALLIGVLFGSYSSIAVAAPILLGFKRMVLTRAAATAEETPVAK
jgi:SecD/SecF fusion protein